MARASRVVASGSIQSRQRRIGGSWTEEEDQRLSRLVETYGERAWVKVAEGFNNIRDKKQCRERWCNHVNPNINGAPFSAEENIFIIDFYIQNGRQWARMSRSKELKGRPDNAIKNHFNTNLLPHYIELCNEHNLPRRQSDNVDPIDQDTYKLIKDKITAPPSVGTRGVKASRFLHAFSCKIESLVNDDDTTMPKTINERRKRAMTMQDLYTSPNRMHIPLGPSSSTSLMQFDPETSKWKVMSMEAAQRQPQWTQMQQSRNRLSPYNDTKDLSESEYSATSPLPTQGRLSNGCSPFAINERSLATTEVEERYSSSSSSLPITTRSSLQLPVNPWCDAAGFYSLPPLVRTSTPPTPSTLFSALSFQSKVDQEQKALLHKKSLVFVNEGEKEVDISNSTRSPRSPGRSLLFAPC